MLWLTEHEFGLDYERIKGFCGEVRTTSGDKYTGSQHSTVRTSWCREIKFHQHHQLNI